MLCERAQKELIKEKRFCCFWTVISTYI